MAVAPAMYLAISDGTTTVTIADGTLSASGVPGSTNYPLVRDQWAPNVTTVKHGLLGGDKYTNVIEEITIHIKASDEATLYSNLQTLNNLLEQATRWAMGQRDATPVVLKYVPKGSTLHSIATPLQATILGVEPGNQTGAASLPVTFNDTDLYYYILNVKLKFKRKGLWLGATENVTTSDSENPTVHTVSWANNPNVPGVLKVAFEGFQLTDITGIIDIPSGYVFITSSPNANIHLVEAEAPASQVLGTSVTATVIADTTASASEIYRLDFVGGTQGQETLLRYAVPSAMQNIKRLGIFLNYRNNSVTDYTIRAQGWKIAAQTNLIPSTPYNYIPPVVNNPTPLFLGIVSNTIGFDTIQIAIAFGSTFTSPGTLDFDSLVFVDMDSSDTYVISFNTASSPLTLGASYASKDAQIVIENNPLTQRIAQLYLNVLSPDTRLPGGTYYGDISIMAKGNKTYCLWYCTHLFNGVTQRWTTADRLGAGAVLLRIVTTRRLGYIIPQ